MQRLEPGALQVFLEPAEEDIDEIGLQRHNRLDVHIESVAHARHRIRFRRIAHE